MNVSFEATSGLACAAIYVMIGYMLRAGRAMPANDQDPHAAFTIPAFTLKIGSLFVGAVGAVTLAYVYATEPWRSGLVFFAAALAAAGQVVAAIYTAKALKFSLDAGRSAALSSQQAHAELVAVLKHSLARLDQTNQEAATAKHRRLLADTAMRFGERWNETSMLQLRKECKWLIDNKDDAKFIKDELSKDPTKEAHVRNVLNFLEELALSVNRQQCDEAIAKDLFSGIVFHIWNATSGWAHEVRVRRGRAKVWVELEALYGRWKM